MKYNKFGKTANFFFFRYRRNITIITHIYKEIVSGKYEKDIPYCPILKKQVNTAGNQEFLTYNVGKKIAPINKTRNIIDGAVVVFVQETIMNNNNK